MQLSCNMYECKYVCIYVGNSTCIARNRSTAPQSSHVMLRAQWDHTILPATHKFYTRKGRTRPGTLHLQRITKRCCSCEIPIIKGLGLGLKIHPIYFHVSPSSAG